MGIYKSLQSGLERTWEFIDKWVVLPVGVVMAGISAYEFWVGHGSGWEVLKEAGYLVFAILFLLRALTRYLKRDALKGFPTIAGYSPRAEIFPDQKFDVLKRYYYMSDEVIALLSELNSKHFQNTDYDYPKESVVRRNKSIAKKNPFAFMIVNDPLLFNRASLGYISIIPIDAATRDIYLRGRLSDVDLTGDMVTAQGIEPAALLLFAIAKKDLGSVRANTAAFKYLSAHLSVYVSDLARAHPISANIMVIAQSSDKGTTDVLRMMGLTEVKEQNKTISTLDGGLLFSADFEKFANRIRGFAHHFMAEEKIEFH